MTAGEGVALGALQGATEFLPVSSSGHLSLAESALSVHPPSLFFDVALHLGTLVAVLIVFRGPLRQLLVGLLRRDRAAWRGAGLLVLATLPTVAIALAARDLLEARLSPRVVGGLLVANGLMLVATSRAPKGTAAGAGAGAGAADDGGYWDMAPWKAVLIGVAQGIAVLPGISRSGSTISAALMLGVRPRAAATFSFLLSIPAILGAALLTAKDLATFDDAEVASAAIGALVAAAVGILALRLLLGMLARARFHHFGFYCVIVGAMAALGACG